VTTKPTEADVTTGGRDEELLVARCQLGDPAAFDDLVARWHEPLWRYVRGASGDAVMAEDVLQDGWLRILRGIDRLQDAARLRPWLFSIVRRALMDRLRTRYTHESHEPLDDIEPADEGVADELAWADRDRLMAALDMLPAPERETITLFYLEELDLKEVAQLQGVPVGTVKSRLHRARRLLRERLTSHGV
jgi:RNA polymerase sigma factor (sigma-70 family)